MIPCPYYFAEFCLNSPAPKSRIVQYRGNPKKLARSTAAFIKWFSTANMHTQTISTPKKIPYYCIRLKMSRTSPDL